MERGTKFYDQTTFSTESLKRDTGRALQKTSQIYSFFFASTLNFCGAQEFSTPVKRLSQTQNKSFFYCFFQFMNLKTNSFFF